MTLEIKELVLQINVTDRDGRHDAEKKKQLETLVNKIR